MIDKIKVQEVIDRLLYCCDTDYARRLDELNKEYEVPKSVKIIKPVDAKKKV